MKLSFTTLGCPQWDLDTICDRGRAYGFQGVDFRGYLETLDITLLPEFTKQVAETRRKLSGAGLEVSAISSSISVCDIKKRDANLAEARRTIEVAHELGASIVRIYGGGDLAAPAEELVKIGRDCFEIILAVDGAQDLFWLFETHDRWATAAGVQLLLDAIQSPHCGVLLDVANIYLGGLESPEEIFDALLGQTGYVHVKDAIYDPKHPQAMDNGWYYVLPGAGQIPLVKVIHALKASGYDGWLMFEHEKRWHPNLPEPEEVFPAFVSWARKF